jgi:D-beta-D-heptose 7-phosphate kinase / D-beta-D-heptose 1-phosphate adenosyltransferase
MSQLLDFSPFLARLPTAQILVIGDIMLDRFVYGDVHRISPESPIPVLSIKRESYMLGGAGNVLSNLNGLEAKADIIATIGQDAEAKLVTGLIESFGYDPSYVVSVSDRPTTVKTRFLAQNQQLLRTDFEQNHALSATDQDTIKSLIHRLLQEKNYGAIILSDYGKGLLSEDLLRFILQSAKQKNCPVLVDPKGQDYSKYAGASVVTPNRKELSEATQNRPTLEDEDVVKASQYLIDQSGIAAIVATRSQDGMTIVEKDQHTQQFLRPLHLRTQAREVYDVSGAGDTVIATIACGLSIGANLLEASQLANIAGGIVVGKIGTAPIRLQDLKKWFDENASTKSHSVSGDQTSSSSARAPLILQWPQALEQVERWKARGLRVGLTNGCFDILHAGHVNYLNDARYMCDRLVLAINHDQSVRLLKGPTRPVNNEMDRATVIGSLASIDMVVFFGAEKEGEDNTATELIRLLKPDLYFKGADYTIERIPEAKIVQSYGGQVKLVPLTEGLSTTNIIKKMSDPKAA